MNKTRNSNIEILRIVSIIMIVISHYCVHGIGTGTISGLSLGFNRFILEILMLGNLGSILFVLISGYYLSNSNGIKYKKIIRLVFQVFFYSSLIYIILYFMGLVPFSIKSLIKALMPITYKEYWFASVYIILYLFHPYINRLLSTFNRREFLIFIGLLFTIFSVIATFTTSNFYGNELIQFLMFYCIGAYLHKYPDNALGKNKNNYKLLFISALFIVMSVIAFDILGTKISLLSGRSVYFLGRTSPFAIIVSVTLLDIFSRKKVFENKIINTIGLLIFGVYLISDNNYIRPILWGKIFKCVEYINEPYLILHILFASIITIIACLLIEAVRKYLIENTIFKRLDKSIDKMQSNVFKKISSN